MLQGIILSMAKADMLIHQVIAVSKYLAAGD
jgi:hypothetical protein